MNSFSKGSFRSRPVYGYWLIIIAIIFYIVFVILGRFRNFKSIASIVLLFSILTLGPNIGVYAQQIEEEVKVDPYQQELIDRMRSGEISRDEKLKLGELFLKQKDGHKQASQIYSETLEDYDAADSKDLFNYATALLKDNKFNDSMKLFRYVKERNLDDKNLVKSINDQVKLALNKQEQKKKEEKKKKDNKDDKDKKKKKDEKKHKKIGKAVEKDLKKPEKKKDLTIDELYAIKTKKARALEKKHQKKLAKGIKITFGDLAKEKKDGDIDFKVWIGPNDYEIKFEVDGPEENEGVFKVILDRSFKAAGEAYSPNLGKEEFKKDQKAIKDVTLQDGTKCEGEKTAESNDLSAKEAAEIAAIKKTGHRVHDAITSDRVKYKRASKAQYVDNNTFSIGSGRFFVETQANYYIVPAAKAMGQYYYALGKRTSDNILEKEKSVLIKQKPTGWEGNVDRIDSALLGNDRERLNFIKQETVIKTFNQYKKMPITIGVPTSLSDQYAYTSLGRDPLKPNEAKAIFKNYPS